MFCLWAVEYMFSRSQVCIRSVITTIHSCNPRSLGFITPPPQRHLNLHSNPSITIPLNHALTLNLPWQWLVFWLQRMARQINNSCAGYSVVKHKGLFLISCLYVTTVKCHNQVLLGWRFLFIVGFHKFYTLGLICMSFEIIVDKKCHLSQSVWSE